MKTLLFGFGLLVCLSSCKKIDVPPGTPSCIKQKIRIMEKDKESFGGVVIERWEVNHTIYYVFPPPRVSADKGSDMYDEYCNLICNVGGGWNPNNNGCPDLKGAVVTSLYTIPK